MTYNFIPEEYDITSLVGDELLNKKRNMNKIGLMFRSRTFWTIVVLFLYNGLASVHDLLPLSFAPLVNGLLSVAAVWFKMNPSNEY